MKQMLFTMLALGFVTTPVAAATQFQVTRTSSATEYIYPTGKDMTGQIHQATMGATAEVQSAGYRTAMSACGGGRMMTYYVSMPYCSASGTSVTCSAQVNVTCMR